jgi:ABC-type Fe3+ transport system substrate-binding protein
MAKQSRRSRPAAVGLAAAAAFALLGSASRAEQADVEAAKREGAVTWYTAQIVDQFARPAAEAFQKKYGIVVKFVRSDSATMALRVFNESKSGHPIADVVDGTSGFAELKKQNLLLKWLPDEARQLPKEAVDPDGYWVANNEFIHTMIFNTTLVPRGTEPTSFDDLLDPKWKGKMAWASHSSTSGGAGFVGLVLASMGEDKGMAWLQKLKQQSVAGLGGSSTSVVDQVAADEYSLALQVFNHDAVIEDAEGAPLDWTQKFPAMGIFDVSATLREAPHPDAAKLFESFLVSDEGQRLFQRSNYIPVDPAVPPKVAGLRPDGVRFRAIFFTPEQIASGLPKWFGIYTQDFR